jgi:class 3 adenylate cyclase
MPYSSIKKSVLLVADDNPENIRVIKEILSQEGDNYILMTVPNGKILVEMAKKKKPNLIITDWEMPEMDGLEATKAIKQDPEIRDIPILMYTGIMTSPKNLQTALEAGAVDFIRKPIEATELLARVQSMLLLAASYRRIKEQKEEIERERKKSEELLLNILPEEVAEELKQKGVATPKHYALVSVLFTDLKGFTSIAEKLSAEEIIQKLNYCFQAFDQIVQKYDLEKIKTIGDAYMCAGGIPNPNTTNPVDIVRAALEMQEFMQQWKTEAIARGEAIFELRLGINTGSVVAGVIGTKKFAYDVWGDTVNLASRMESSGEVGKVNISGATYELVKDYFHCTHRGKIEAKNKGEIDMYFVDSAK